MPKILKMTNNFMYSVPDEIEIDGIVYVRKDGIPSDRLKMAANLDDLKNKKKWVLNPDGDQVVDNGEVTTWEDAQSRAEEHFNDETSSYDEEEWEYPVVVQIATITVKRETKSNVEEL